MNFRYLLLLVLILLSPFALSAQKRDRHKAKLEEKALDNGEFYYAENNYLRALPYYQNLIKIDSLNPFYHYRAGICYLYKNDEREKAVVELEKAKMMDPKLELIDLYLGRAYHANYRFDDAIKSFQMALSDAQIKSKEVSQIQLYISYCENGKKYTTDSVEVDIRNVGSSLNTSASEYVPVVTSDESMLIFTYRGPQSLGGLQDAKFRPDTSGEYYEDIMMSSRVGNNWLSPEPITSLNSKAHDASIALSNDGQILYIFKSTNKDGGDIFQSILIGSVWTEPTRLGSNINTKYWEGSCSLSSDGQLLYFASDRPGGFGGRDIYVSRKQSDGTWGVAQNLGPDVNSSNNEDAPFIHPDGIHLFFSSDGKGSMGGYDLFYTKTEGGVWASPINMGYPINTPSDERYYVLTADGLTAYYSSDNKGGFGREDIYTVAPGFQGELPVLALIVGFVTVNGNPSEAKITVSDSLTGNKYGEYLSNATSGKYLIALRPGNTYKVAIEIDGEQPLFEYVNVKDIDTYIQVNKDYNFSLDSLGGDSTSRFHAVLTDSVDILQKKFDLELQKVKEESNDIVYERRMYQEVLNKHGNDYDSTSSYVVELGTFVKPADFDSANVASVGSIHLSVTPEGYYRYTLGPFKTLLEAEKYRLNAVSKDTSLSSTSEVVVVKNGERKTIPSVHRNEYRRKGYVPREDTRVIRPRLNSMAVTNTNNTRTTNDTLIKDNGTFQAAGLTYKLELGAVTDSTQFDRKYWEQFGKVEKRVYPDGTIRYTMGPWNTLKEAEDYKAYLISKDSSAENSIVTIFYFGQRKTVQEYFDSAPCNGDPLDLTWFKGKSLNDTAVYNRFLKVTGNYCSSELVYTIQIGAYRHPENFKYPQLSEFGPAQIKESPDGITRFTLKEFKTILEAEEFRQVCIKRGIRDAWITAVYNGERKTLEDLIENNFYGKAIQ